MDTLTPCPNCGGHTLYQGPDTSAGGGHAPNWLPGLGSFWRPARLTLVLCRDCGLARFFASKDARARLKESRRWRAVSPSDRGGMR
jgi:hypothetical protein